MPSATWLSLDVLKPTVTEPPCEGRGGSVLTIPDSRYRQTRHGRHVHLGRFGNSDGIPFHPSALNQQGPKQHGKSSVAVFKGRKQDGDGYPWASILM